MNKSKRYQIISLVCTSLRYLRLHNQGLILLALISLLSFPLFAQQAWTPERNKHYRLLADTQPSELQQIELFCWLGSPSCFQIESALSDWRDDQDITVINTPLIKRPEWRLLAKARLVAQQMEIENDLVESIYRTIHIESESIETEEQLFAHIEAFGLEPSRFANQFYSAATNKEIKRIQNRADTLPIVGVPTIIINNQWLIDASMIENSRQMLIIIEQLINDAATP